MAAREISYMIKNNDIQKFYKAMVNGIVKKDSDTLINRYEKDEKKNIAKIYDDIESVESDMLVKLDYKVLKRMDEMTLLYIKLYTGKSHQIRAQLSHIGHPIVGDKKYMKKDLYEMNKNVYKKKFQELACVKIIFGSFAVEELKYLNNKCFEITI